MTDRSRAPGVSMPGLLCLDRFLWSSFGKYTTKSFISLTALKINGCVFLNTPHNKAEDKEKEGEIEK